MGTVYARTFLFRLANIICALSCILTLESQGIRGHTDTKSLLPQGKRKVHIRVGLCDPRGERG